MSSLLSCTLLGSTIIAVMFGRTNCATSTDVGYGTIWSLDDTQDVWLENSSNMRLQYPEMLLVGQATGYPIKRFLVQFEDIPLQCSKVVWAKLHLFCFRSARASFYSPQESPDIPRTLQVHQVLKAWNESQATRDVRLTSVPWSQPYLALDGTDAALYPQDSITLFPVLPQSFVTFDITEAARNWKQGSPNNGLLVWATNEILPGTDFRFYSKRRDDIPGFMAVRPYVTVLCPGPLNSTERMLNDRGPLLAVDVSACS